jgi:dTDP-4-amino-4,6-dideoxygalactose transaminase
VCDEIVSLPLHPQMTDDDVATVAQAVAKGH